MPALPPPSQNTDDTVRGIVGSAAGVKGVEEEDDDEEELEEEKGAELETLMRRFLQKSASVKSGYPN